MNAKKVAASLRLLQCLQSVMKCYTTVKHENIGLRFTIKLGLNVSENDKIMLLEPRQPLFFSVQSVVFTGGQLVAMMRAG